MHVIFISILYNINNIYRSREVISPPDGRCVYKWKNQRWRKYVDLFVPYFHINAFKITKIPGIIKKRNQS